MSTPENMRHFSEIFSGSQNLKPDICNVDEDTIRALYLQPKGRLTFQEKANSEGTTIIGEKKIKSFFERARIEKFELVLTPEYSVPLPTLSDIVEDKGKWPPAKKIWCLCIEGVKEEKFHEKLDVWDSDSEVKIGNQENYSSRDYVNALVYLQTERNESHQNTLYLGVQYKKIHLSPTVGHEHHDMCRGQKMIVFEGRNHVFLSLICSDIAGGFKSDVFNYFRENPSKDITIFHPQLNPDPRHESFLQFRRNLYQSFSGKSKSITTITLNWADETIVTDKEGRECSYNEPWSVIYEKGRVGEQDIHELKKRNHKKGTFFAYNRFNYNNVWFNPRFEHAKLILFSKSSGNEPPVQNDVGITTKDLYVFDDVSQKWQSLDYEDIKSRLKSTLKDIFDADEANYRKCLHYSPEEVDMFFGLCFLYYNSNDNSLLLEKGEQSVDRSEVISRMVVGSDETSDQEREKKAEYLNRLISQLRSGNFPKELAKMKDGHTFDLTNDNQSTCQSELSDYCFNLKPRGFNDCEPILVSYPLDSRSRPISKKEVGKVQKAVDQENLLPEKKGDRLLLFFQAEDGSVSYFCPMNTNYKKGDRTDNPTSWKD